MSDPHTCKSVGTRDKVTFLQASLGQSNEYSHTLAHTHTHTHVHTLTHGIPIPIHIHIHILNHTSTNVYYLSGCMALWWGSLSKERVIVNPFSIYDWCVSPSRASRRLYVNPALNMCTFKEPNVSWCVETVCNCESCLLLCLCLAPSCHLQNACFGNVEFTCLENHAYIRHVKEEVTSASRNKRHAPHYSATKAAGELSNKYHVLYITLSHAHIFESLSKTLQ
jgi:hypothetical protein